MLVSESPIEVGVFDPSRPDFPDMGVSVFSNSHFLYKHRRGQPAIFIIANSKAKINKNSGKFQHFTKIFTFASTITFFGASGAFSKAKFKFKNKNAASHALFLV